MQEPEGTPKGYYKLTVIDREGFIVAQGNTNDREASTNQLPFAAQSPRQARKRMFNY